MEYRDRRNAVLHIIGEGLWGLQTYLVFASTVLTVLLRDLGASKRLIGSVGAIEGGFLVLPQFIGLYFFSSHRLRKRRLMIWHYTVIIPFLFLNGILLTQFDKLSPATVSGGLILGYAGYMGAIGVALSAWMDWLAHLFHKKIRGTIMGIAFAFYSLLGVVGGLFASWLLSRYPRGESLIVPPIKGVLVAKLNVEPYIILYFAAGIIASLSMICFSLVADPAAETDPANDPPPPSLPSILGKFRESLRDHAFLNFLVGRVLASLGFCMIPFIAMYYLSVAGGGLASSIVVGCGAATPFGTALANLILGRLGDRHGHRIGIVVGSVAQIFALTLMLTGTGFWSCIFTYLCTGVVISSAFLSHNNMLYETCPHDHRMAHITVGNLVLSLPLLAAPILAGIVAQQQGTTRLFMICLGFSILALLWFLAFVKDPRQVNLCAVRG